MMRTTAIIRVVEVEAPLFATTPGLILGDFVLPYRSMDETKKNSGSRSRKFQEPDEGVNVNATRGIKVNVNRACFLPFGVPGPFLSCSGNANT